MLRRRGPSSLCRSLILIFGFAIAFQLTRIIIKQLETTSGQRERFYQLSLLFTSPMVLSEYYSVTDTVLVDKEI